MGLEYDWDGTKLAVKREDEPTFTLYVDLQGPAGASEAINVSYDNSTSSLDADNVQDAIDEIVAEGLPGGTGMFEIDVNGGLMPITDILPDQYFEIDDNGDLMPKEAY